MTCQTRKDNTVSFLPSKWGLTLTWIRIRIVSYAGLKRRENV